MIFVLLVGLCLPSLMQSDGLQEMIKEAIEKRDEKCLRLSNNFNKTQHCPTVNSSAIYHLIANEDCPNISRSDNRTGIADAYTWLYSILSATAINFSAMSGCCFQPLMNRSIFLWILMWMIGVGVGSMCSVSVLQLIPEALNVELAKGVERWKVVVIMVAIFAFYLSDRCLNVLRYVKHRRESTIEIGVSLSDNAVIEEDTSTFVHVESFGNIDIAQIKNGLFTWCFTLPPIVWMVFVGDALHNFVDGVTIGAAFSDTPKRGVSTFLGIFFEELPCELGDFAVFIKSGLSLRTSIIFNMLSSSTNYIGLIVGILISGFEGSVHSWIYCVAGGMFLYISLGVMLVEMSDMEDKLIERAERRQQTKLLSTVSRIMIVQVSGLVIGFGIQLIVLYYTLENN